MQNNLNKFMKEINNKNILVKNTGIEKYLYERRGNFNSIANYVIFPKNTEEVSFILKQANIFLINIVPQGGNTGLVGASFADEFDVIVNFSNMNKIIALDTINQTVIVEAGLKLADLNEYLKKHQLEFPLYLPSYMECSIGGNIATNAGGINTIKYGNTKDLILGIEGVFPNGEIINDLHILRKRNIGFDMKNIFVGMEGTLGVVTKASLKVFHIKKYFFNVFIGIDNIKIIKKLINLLNYEFSEYIQSLELMNRQSINIVKDINITSLTIKKIADYNILIQFKSNLNDCLKIIKNKIMNKLKTWKKNEDIVFFEIYGNNNIWEIRNFIPEAQKKLGFNLKNDFAVPIPQIFTTIDKIQKTIKNYNSKYITVIFGHLGDGNLHINIIDIDNKNNLKEKKDEIKSVLVKIIMDANGTFSAEHGIGIINKNYLQKYHKENVSTMIKLKNLMDKNLILNKNKLM